MGTWTPGPGATAGDDEYVGDGAVDIVDGLAGNDTLSGAGGNDVLTGGEGVDAVDGGEGDDVLILRYGDLSAGDSFAGGDGVDTLRLERTGTSYLNTFFLQPFSFSSIETLEFDAGGDEEGATVVTLLSSQFGSSFSSSLTVIGDNATRNYVDIHMVTNVFSIAGVTLVDWDAHQDSLIIYGTTDADTVTGSTGAEVVLGDEGDDDISAGGGNDDLSGEDGADTLRGEQGDDALGGGAGDDISIGGAGFDLLRDESGANQLIGGADGDTYWVGVNLANTTIIELADEGVDTLYFDGTVNGVDDMSTYAMLDAVENFQVFTSSLGAVHLIGNALDNQLSAQVSENEVQIATLDGGAGDDRILGSLYGESTLIGNDGDDSITCFAGGNVLDGGAGDDALGVNTDWVHGGEFTDNTLLGGAGNDQLAVASGVGNRLDGGDGNDMLRAVADNTLIGGAGDDEYVIFSATDTVVDVQEQADEGIDSIEFEFESSVGAVTINASDFANIEWFVVGGNEGAVTFNGDARDNVFSDTTTYAAHLTGFAGDDELIGNGGDDILDGGDDDDLLIGLSGDDTLDGGAGADEMYGHDGSDTYVVDNAGDIISDFGAGIDLVKASISYALGDSIENLTLLGSMGLNATGNALGNTLTGNSGANVLDGGAGADTLRAGAGDDVYIVDNAGDRVTEGTASGGVDRVEASVSFALGNNVENLTLLGTAAISATGNALNNTLTGNSGANILNGKEGADTMAGGDGDDTYGVDSSGDVVTETSAAGGIDQVNSYVHFALGANVENLSLRGSGDIKAVGNALGNTLTGNSGDNILDGKEGADTMSGGAGDDTYGVDSTADVVMESGGGTDRINSYVSLTLVGNVEILSLRGSANLNGAGNNSNNTILGNSGDNILKAGLGLDFMTGGAGDDLFKFDTALSAGNLDTITDFNVADDGLQLKASVFTGIGTAGMLAADAFHTGAAAHDASDRIIYDTTTGALYYDADGDGAGAAIQFAQLGAGLGLTNADIFVV